MTAFAQAPTSNSVYYDSAVIEHVAQTLRAYRVPKDPSTGVPVISWASLKPGLKREWRKEALVVITALKEVIAQ